MTKATEVSARLDAQVAQKDLLQHPFYQRWAAGELTLEDLAFYSTQYWRQVESFTTYLTDLADRLPESQARAVVLENLADERDGDHAGLWIRFAESVGAGEDTVRDADAEAETKECVSAFGDAARSASLPFALGMLYGYESQTPAVARTKVAGLKEHYGINGAGVDYFELHADLDVEHSADLAAAIGTLVGDEPAMEEAATGARAGADAIWTLLDGVARVRGISC